MSLARQVVTVSEATKEASSSLPGPEAGRVPWWLVATVVAIPLLFSIRSISDAYGQTEEAVNAAIWALGGRNILEHGPIDAKLGAMVAPYPGSGGGIYAHHPPLPVWLSAILQVFGTSEVLPRLAGLLALGAALVLLYRALALLVPPHAALLGVAASATSGFALTYGRLFTTLTTATPLFAAMMFLYVRRLVTGKPPGWPLGVLLTLSVFSSWDGVIGAAAIIIANGVLELLDRKRVGRWSRALWPAAVGTGALAALLGYLTWANGGPEELIRQALYRTGVSDAPYTAAGWIRKHLEYFHDGLGLVGIAALVCAPALLLLTGAPRRTIVVLALYAVPGLGMVLLLQQGSYGHAFWGFNLLLSLGAAFAFLADWLRRQRPTTALPAIVIALGTHFILNARIAGEQLGRERDLNSVGTLTQRLQAPSASEPVRMFSAYAFHPYATWYLRGPMDVALSTAAVREKRQNQMWKNEDRVLVDSEFARNAGCRPMPYEDISASRRWLIVRVGTLLENCVQ